MGLIVKIFVCNEMGQSMQVIDRAYALAGKGLAEDRYASRKGAWSRSKRETIRQVSLIAEEAIAEANAGLAVPFAPEETRRNILTRGIDLNDLVGKRFSVGGVLMQGVELCDPCARPSKLSGKEGFEQAFTNRGGLRAEILFDGEIQVGDLIQPI